jgi:hypothetical protein
MDDTQPKKQQTGWTEKILLGLVVGSVLFCAGLLAFPIWSVITQTTSQQTEPYQCVTMNDDAARLDCYDRQAGRSPTPPAKGANPPAVKFGR